MFNYAHFHIILVVVVDAGFGDGSKSHTGLASIEETDVSFSLKDFIL